MPTPDNQRFSFGLIVAAGFLGAIVALMLWPFPEAAENALLVLIGILGKAFSDVVGYHYNTSAGSASKQGDLNSIINAMLGRPVGMMPASPTAAANERYRAEHPILDTPSAFDTPTGTGDFNPAMP